MAMTTKTYVIVQFQNSMLRGLTTDEWDKMPMPERAHYRLIEADVPEDEVNQRLVDRSGKGEAVGPEDRKR